MIVIGYFEERFIDLFRVRGAFKSYGPSIKSFSSSSVKFNQAGFADYNIFDVEHLADELMLLFDEKILKVVFGGDKGHMKKNVMLSIVNECCVSFLCTVEV